MQGRWTRRAQRRLDRCVGYLALYSAPAAEDALTHILGDVAMLAEHLLLGHKGRYIGTRELVLEGGRYIVVYRVRGQVVQIVTIHDARQQWPEDWRTG